jgi:hypothetical protein
MRLCATTRLLRAQALMAAFRATFPGRKFFALFGASCRMPGLVCLPFFSENSSLKRKDKKDE